MRSIWRYALVVAAVVGSLSGGARAESAVAWLREQPVTLLDLGLERIERALLASDAVKRYEGEGISPYVRYNIPEETIEVIVPFLTGVLYSSCERVWRSLALELFDVDPKKPREDNEALMQRRLRGYFERRVWPLEALPDEGIWDDLSQRVVLRVYDMRQECSGSPLLDQPVYR